MRLSQREVPGGENFHKRGGGLWGDLMDGVRRALCCPRREALLHSGHGARAGPPGSSVTIQDTGAERQLWP